MKIYEYKGFPNPLRVRMALAEKGMLDKVEFVQIDVPKGEHKKPEYLAKNPAGVVPLLELDDGTCIGECSAITEYFDHLDDSPTLTGKGAKQRAQIHMQQRRVEANLLDAVGTFFHHATPGLGKEIEGYQCAEWGEKQKERALQTIEDLNVQLEGQKFIAGDDFSIADITAYAGFVFGGFCDIGIPGHCQNVAAWHERIKSRPSANA